MRAVAIWGYHPTAKELLDHRLVHGWTPTPSGLRGGARVLGYAACLFEANPTTCYPKG